MHSLTAGILAVGALLSCISSSLGATCRRYPTVTNLNIPDHMGNWGIHGLIVSEGAGPDPQLNCLHIDLSATQFTVEPVNIDVSLAAVQRESGSAISANYAASIPLLSRPGQWTVNMNGTTHAFSIIQTDYVEYSLMVDCVVVDDVEVTKFLLASRSHNQMPDTIVNNYKAVIQADFGFDTSRHYPVTHGHACH